MWSGLDPHVNRNKMIFSVPIEHHRGGYLSYWLLGPANIFTLLA